MTTKTERETHIDDLLLRLAGLVRARELLDYRDVSDVEFQAADTQIERLHWQLARIVQANQRLDRAA